MVLGKWRWKEGERDEWMEPTSLQYPLYVLDVVHRGLECAEQIGPCGTHSQGRGTPEIARASDRDRGPEGAGRDPGQCAAKRPELGRSLEDLSGEWLSPGRRWRSAAGQQSVPRGRESLDASAHRLPRSPGSEHIAVHVTPATGLAGPKIPIVINILPGKISGAPGPGLVPRESIQLSTANNGPSPATSMKEGIGPGTCFW